MLKAPITKVFPWMRDRSTRQGQYEEQISRDQYGLRNTTSQHRRPTRDTDSDEEFILQELGSVRKTTDISINYEEASGKSESGAIKGGSHISSNEKHG